MRDARSFSFPSLLIVSLAAFGPACGDTANTTASGGSGASTTGGGGAGTAGSGATMTGGNGGNGGASTGGTSAGGSTGTAGGGPIVEAPCQNQTYQCGDTVDNDGDGLIDSQDPDCLGPCDNTEDGYYGGIPGDSGPSCTVDCYFDSNSGAGNDECYWNHQCDPNEIDDPGHPEPNAICPYDLDANTPGTASSCDELKAAQTDTCAKVCGPLTPNGCDCFGCCELPAGTGKFVWLGSEDNVTGQGSCDKNNLDDPEKCEPCIPVPSCYNGCAKCELCVGKETVPPECNEGGSGGGGAGGGGGGGTGQCPPGIQACGLPGQAQCGAGFYCITGCCQPIEEPQ